MSVKYIQELVEINSPSGFTDEIILHLEERLVNSGWKLSKNNKGALLVSNSDKPTLVVAAHIDTLGGMVSKIKSDGQLELTQLGGWPTNSFEGEYVTLLTASGKTFRGTFLLNNPAAHVNKKVESTERNMSKMHVRLDAESDSKKESEKLGISIGDFAFFDPRFEISNGYIKSRFMDDKACAGIFLDILLNHKKEIGDKAVAFYFSNYEEVGHGATPVFARSVEELLVADMGVVGDGVAGKETAVSICAKDSSGPYDYSMRRKLEELAQKAEIPFVTDIFPYYGSDGSAALRAGQDLRVALIGPGVNASHGVERTHIKGVQATKDLILEYIKS